VLRLQGSGLCDLEPDQCVASDQIDSYLEPNGRSGITSPSSAVAGHDVAAFVLSLVLHRSNSGADNDNIAQRWLRKVEGDETGPAMNVTWKNEICTRCLQ
jgi:hypothetical protein